MRQDHIEEWSNGHRVFYAVRHKPTGEYLRMSKFNPVTQAPWTGPITQSWIGLYKEQALCQAILLGEDWEAISYLGN